MPGPLDLSNILGGGQGSGDPDIDQMIKLIESLSFGGGGQGPDTSMLEGLLGQIDARPNDAGTVPVPGVTSPIGNILGTFASTVAEGLGARGAQAQFAGGVQRRQEANTKAASDNAMIERANIIEKQQARHDTLLKIGEAELAFAEKQNDIGGIKDALKVNAALQIKLDKIGVEKSKMIQEATGRRMFENIRDRGGQERKNIAARAAAKSTYRALYGNTLAGRKELQRLEAQEKVIVSKLKQSEKENQIARQKYQPTPHTEQELQTMRLEATEEIRVLYEGALEIAAKDPTSIEVINETTGVKKLTAKDF